MAELHIIGQILGGTGFTEQRLFCKWSLIKGSAWTTVEGLEKGQTQVDESVSNSEVIFQHPLDIHLATRGLQGWPRLAIQVWCHSAHGKCWPLAYGVAQVPSSPGIHHLTVPTWRPLGELSDQIGTSFTGVGLELTDADQQVTAQGLDRYQLQTSSMGNIYLELFVVSRNLHKFGIESGH